MQQPPGYPPGGGGYGPPPGGGYGPPPGGGYGPPPGGYGGPPPGGGGGYGGPPPGGGGYGGPPPGGGGYGAPPGGYGGPPPPHGGPPPGGFGGPPMGMQQPPKKDGPSAAVIALIALIAVGVLGLGSCMVCIFVGAKSEAPATATAPDDKSPLPTAQPSNDGTWITSERPFVKFLAPPGWHKDLKGDWGVFTSSDGAAVFAFTTFNQPGESTARLGRAAWVLGVEDIQWGSPTGGTVGADNFKARMGEGTCKFNGPGGYIWYATVDSGSSDQILLIYTVSASGGKAHKDAVLTSIRSLRRRP